MGMLIGGVTMRKWHNAELTCRMQRLRSVSSKNKLKCLRKDASEPPRKMKCSGESASVYVKASCCCIPLLAFRLKNRIEKGSFNRQKPCDAQSTTLAMH